MSNLQVCEAVVSGLAPRKIPQSGGRRWDRASTFRQFLLGQGWLRARHITCIARMAGPADLCNVPRETSRRTLSSCVGRRCTTLLVKALCIPGWERQMVPGSSTG